MIHEPGSTCMPVLAGDWGQANHPAIDVKFDLVAW
jgi:hypothetical protein